MSDSKENHIRRVGPHGIITTLAGPPSDGQNTGLNAHEFGGDRGPAAAARFDFPLGIALAPDGSPYIADSANNRVRRISSALPGIAGLDNLVVAAPSGRELCSPTAANTSAPSMCRVHWCAIASATTRPATWPASSIAMQSPTAARAAAA